jgi:hypothetical protein
MPNDGGNSIFESEASCQVATTCHPGLFSTAPTSISTEDAHTQRVGRSEPQLAGLSIALAIGSMQVSQ